MGLLRCFLLIVLVNGSLACSGQDVNSIVEILLEVNDWRYLADQLEINPDTIEQNCRSPLASCYRRDLVRAYCNAAGLAVEEVAENIADALGPANKRQAIKLRERFPRDSDEYDRPDLESPDTTLPITPLSSGSSDSINDELLSTTLYIGFFMAVAVLFSILLVYAAQHLLYEPPIYIPPASNNTPQRNSGTQYQSTSPHHSVRGDQLSQRRPRTVSDDSLNDPIFDTKVDAASLILIKYRLDGEENELRILKDIAPNWRHLASCLGFSDNEIQIFNTNASHQAGDAADSMLKEWMRRDVQSTWRKLIQKMREVELNVPAENLVIALRNMYIQ